VDQSLEVRVRIVRFVLLIIISISVVGMSVAQQTSVSTAQAINLLQTARAALNPGTPTTDVTLSGSARYIVGGDDETGTAVLKAVAGASRIDLSFPSGTRSEIENGYANGASAPSGSWSGPDGVVHTISFHNLFTDPVWFFPVFPITHGLSGY
jgi:propanediol dehydratase large subunit